MPGGAMCSRVCPDHVGLQWHDYLSRRQTFKLTTQRAQVLAGPDTHVVAAPIFCVELPDHRPTQIRGKCTASQIAAALLCVSHDPVTRQSAWTVLDDGTRVTLLPSPSALCRRSA